ncbi:unnamed protein product [Durusdinium trenchii]|uniref:Uncharacterized protein n=1 Tax=Durusdinium trenchii TaxID=1381693 RepID=A0ABP0PXE7_9DINO
MALPIPKLEIPTPERKADKGTPGTPERSVPVSARTRIATAGKVFAMTKVYEPSSALSDDSDDDSSTESERERNAPKQLRVPPLPLLLDGKCGLPAKPSIPRLNCVHEDSMLSSDLLSSSEDEGEEELLVEFEAPMVSQRSQLVPLSFRSALQSEATQISLDLTAMSKASRCASASGLGAMAGTASGAVLGFLSGILPAPLTLGLSVPINAGLGSMGGMILGTAGGLICQSLDVVQIDAVQAESPMTQRALDTQRTAASSARGTPGVLLKFALANDTPEESRSVFDGFSGERRTGQV